MALQFPFASDTAGRKRLHADDVLFFRLCQLVDPGDVGVSEFLNFLETVAFVVFRNLFVLQQIGILTSLPSFEGLRPRSAERIAFSIAGTCV